MDSTTELAARLQRLEDVVAITQLIASYGPLVDAGAADEVAEMWTEDGSYDVEGWLMADREAIRSMVLSRPHQRFIATGSLHFMGTPHLTVDGDTAVAVCESLLVLREGEGFTIARGGANRIELARTQDGWRFTRRIARTLDGAAEARALLRS